MRANVRFDHHLLAVETEHRVHGMLELVAPPAPEGTPRPPLNLALVIDRSGSMAGDKLAVTRECAAFLVRRLAPTDRFGLVAYDDEVRLLAPLAPVGEQPHLLGTIAAIWPGNMTNLSGGWLKGVELVHRAEGEGPRKVLLLTDGLANVGVTEPGALEAMARRAFEAERVGTTTIGFGADFDEDLLTAMADAGGGNAYHAETPDQAPAIFAEQFEGLMSLVAQNVSVEIRPSEQVRVLGILNEYPQVPVAGGVQVQLGDAYGEETRRVVFELRVPSLASLGPATLAEVVLRYVTVGEEVATHEVSIPLTVNLVSADEAAADALDAEVTEEVVVLKAARAQREARELADQGEFEQARKVLRDAAGELRSRAPSSERAEDLLAQAEELDDSFGAMSPAGYDLLRRKKLHYQSRSVQRRRRKPKTDDRPTP
jgi:Ca-activated chloride channel family protein